MSTFSAYMWGWNNKQMGPLSSQSKNNEKISKNSTSSQESILLTPTIMKPPSNKKIKFVACGGSHSLVVTNKIYSIGRNEFGQLGVGDTKDRTELTEMKIGDKQKVHIDSTILAVACGDQYSIVVDGQNNVWCTGKNKNGQLGVGKNTTSVTSLVLNEFLDPNFPSMCVVDVVCGSRHSLFMNVEGGILSCGFGKFGALGHGNNLPKLFATAISFPFEVDQKQIMFRAKGHLSVSLSAKGSVYMWGGKRYEESDQEVLLIKKKIKNNSPLKVCGNIFGKRVKDIACSSQHIMILTDKSVFEFGHSLENSGHTYYLEKILESRSNEKKVILSDGTMGGVVLHGSAKELEKENLDLSNKYVLSTTYGKYKLWRNHYLEGKDIVSISCSEQTNFAILKSGKVLFWGNVERGESGNEKEGEKKVLKPKFVKNLKSVSKIITGCWNLVALVK